MRYILTLYIILIPVLAFADPVVRFSDITSGPKTGNTDGVGSGAIVTIWGNNLGSTRDTSKVYVGNVEATAIYYWKDADGALPGGPSDLSTYHKMQEIAFAIPSGASDGVNTISVTVAGETSNTLPFTVRAGRILYVKSTGSDTTGDGSWSNPYATLSSVFAGGNGKVAAGDIVYSVGAGTSSGVTVGASATINGTDSNPVALVAYPNTTVALSGVDGYGYTINNYNNQDDTLASKYVHLSKLSLTTTGSGIRTFQGGRIVGTEITGPDVYGGYSGAIGGNHLPASGGKYLGLYIHNYGTDNDIATIGGAGTDPSTCGTIGYPECGSSWDVFQHLFYISVRQATTNEAYEIGYCNLKDNPIMHGIHVYDQGVVGGWNGTLMIHDNVVINQRYHAIHILLNDATLTQNPEIQIYNNIVISDADDVYNYRALHINAPHSTAKVFNNTVVGYNDPIDILTTTEFRNNIVYDTKNKGLIWYEPATHTNNLYYGSLLPSFISTEACLLNTDPLFADAANYDFSPQSISTTLAAGYDTTSVAPRDFLGNLRASTPAIGAIDVVGTASVVPGVCGTSNGLALSTAPTVELCTAGTASTVTGGGPWSWTCAGSGGGSTANCSATLLEVPPAGDASALVACPVIAGFR